MTWEKGRGILGPLKPLLGQWVTAIGKGGTAAAAMRCSRTFSALGKGWVELDARWEVEPGKEYRERAIFGAGEDGRLGCFSFTSDGKRSVGRLADGSDVHPQAVAFEAQMPAVVGPFQSNWELAPFVRIRPAGQRHLLCDGFHPLPTLPCRAKLYLEATCNASILLS